MIIDIKRIRANQLADQRILSIHTCTWLNANFAEYFRFSYCVSGLLRCTTCLSYGEKIITVGAVSSKGDFFHFVFSVSSHSTPLHSSLRLRKRSAGANSLGGKIIGTADYMHTRETERDCRIVQNFAERKSERKYLTSEANRQVTKLRRYRV